MEGRYCTWSLLLMIAIVIAVDNVNGQRVPLPPLSVFQLYLELGTGRLVLSVHGRNGTVCAEGFDQRAAQVVCNMMNGPGRSVANFFPISSEGGPRPRMVWWERVMCPMGNESTILDCYYPGWGDRDCRVNEDAAIRCMVATTAAPPPPTPPTTPPVSSFFNLWLQGGFNAYSGRVVARWYDTTGTICSINFDRRDAQVVCRMLGYQGEVVRIQNFGPGTGQVLLTDLNCRGDELTLLDCPIGGWSPSNCLHSQDIGVVCGGGILIPTVSPRPRVDFGSEIVLRGGPDPYHGILHVRTGSTLATVCGSLFGPREAMVVCRQLRARSEFVTLDNLYGPGSGLIFLEDFICRGAESNLNECTLSATSTQTCAHTQDISVGCGPLRNPNQAVYEVFLVNGPSSRHGRLVVQYYGVRGTVCDRNFGTREAQVVCRGLGYSGSGIEVVGNLYGSGQDGGPILLDQVNCTGGERTLADCRSRGWGRHMCDHSQDVSIHCGPTPPGTTVPISVSLQGGPDRFHGRVTITFMGVQGTVCDDSFDDRDAVVVCREIGYNNSSTEAGASGGPDARFAANYFGAGTGRIYYDDVNCAGTETSITQCRTRGLGTHNCVHSEDVSVLCGPRINPVPRQRIFLLGGPDRLHGVLHIEYIGRNGTVCDDSFGREEAYVVCRQLGYQGSIDQVEPSNRYGRGQSTQIWLDEVLCTGRESAITDCFYSDWGVNDCSHEEDVSISCGPVTGLRCPTVPPIVNGRASTTNTVLGTQVFYTCNPGFRLSDNRVLTCRQAFVSATPQWNPATAPRCISDQMPTQPPTIAPAIAVQREVSGRFLLVLNGRPGSICTEGITPESAGVLCRMLGLSSQQAAIFAIPRPAGDNLMTWVTNLQCSGTESSILTCPFTGMAVACQSGQDVGINCRPNPDPGPGPGPTPIGCGVRLSNKIFGGTVAVPGMWPWVVALIDLFGDPFCGGVLISPDWVATAAHCTAEIRNPSEFRIRVGSNNVGSGGRIMEVRRIIMHPGFSGFSNINDVALLQLTQSAPLDDNTRTLCLSSSLPEIPTGPCYVAGWGITGPGTTTSQRLRAAILPIVPDSVCARIFDTTWNSANMTCAGVPGGRQDVCMGDSGSPLMCQRPNSAVYDLYGLVTGGRPCGLLTGTYGIYVDIRRQISWIRRYVPV